MTQTKDNLNNQYLGKRIRKRLAPVGPKVRENIKLVMVTKTITMYSNESNLYRKNQENMGGKVKCGQQTRVRTGHSSNGCRQVEIEVETLKYASPLSLYCQKYLLREKIPFCGSTSTYKNIFPALGSTHTYFQRKIPIPYPYDDLKTFHSQ